MRNAAHKAIRNGPEYLLNRDTIGHDLCRIKRWYVVDDHLRDK